MFNTRAWLQKYTPFVKEDRPRDTDTSGYQSEMTSLARSGDVMEEGDDLLAMGGDFDWESASEESDDDAYGGDERSGALTPGGPYKNYSHLPSKPPRTCCRDIYQCRADFFACQWLFTSIRKMAYYLPCTQWIPRYNIRENLLWDLLAGLTVGAVVVPQGIAYAGLAHLPPAYGLYTSWMPMIIYFMMGTSRQLAVGPEGVVALLTGSAVSLGFVEGSMDPYEYTVPRAAVLTILVGVISLLLGIFRVGFLDNLLSRPILHGYVSASACIIMVGQLDKLLGFSVSQQEWEKLVGVIENIDQTNYYSLGIGLTCLVILLVTDFIKRHFGRYLGPFRLLPVPLIIVIATTLLVYFTGWAETEGVRVLGNIQGGFPYPVVPVFWDVKLVRSLILEAVCIAVVGFVESNAIAKQYALENSYEISSNRELVAFGTANIAGFSLVASTVVIIAVVFLMPLFHYLPKSAIGAIVMSAAYKLISLHLGFLIRIRAGQEIALTLITLVATFFLGPELGIVLAISISIFLVVKHTTLPNIEVIGRTEEGKWGDVRVLKHNATTYPGIIVIRINESLYFGNVEQLLKMINRIGSLEAHPTDKPSHKKEVGGLIIDARNIPSIDANSLNVMKDLLKEFKKRSMVICFAHLREEHIRRFHQAGLMELFDLSHYHLTVDSALRFIQDRQHATPTPDVGYGAIPV